MSNGCSGFSAAASPQPIAQDYKNQDIFIGSVVSGLCAESTSRGIVRSFREEALRTLVEVEWPDPWDYTEWTNPRNLIVRGLEPPLAGQPTPLEPVDPSRIDPEGTFDPSTVGPEWRAQDLGLVGLGEETFPAEVPFEVKSREVSGTVVFQEINMLLELSLAGVQHILETARLLEESFIENRKLIGEMVERNREYLDHCRFEIPERD